MQTPVKSNPMEAVELNDLVNLEVSDGTDEGAGLSFTCITLTSAICPITHCPQKVCSQQSQPMPCIPGTSWCAPLLLRLGCAHCTSGCMLQDQHALSVTGLDTGATGVLEAGMQGLQRCVYAGAGADLLRSWFAGFLRSREIAEIDKVIQNEHGGSSSSRRKSQQEESTERPLGPLQVRTSILLANLRQLWKKV